MGDAVAILDMELSHTAEGSVQQRRAGPKASRRSVESTAFKRPEGMHRELYALLCGDGKDPSPLIPTDVMPSLGGVGGGYKSVKAKLGLKKARPWRWMPFINPGRKDGFRLHHWRRIADEGKEYPFSKFNKTCPVISYTDAEYDAHLNDTTNGNDGNHGVAPIAWTRAETDHLIELCKRFDLRFIIIHDRWDRNRFPEAKSVEDLKERYYNICNILTKARSASSTNPADEQIMKNLKVFDAAHERKRKEQLIKLYNRTDDEIEEEQNLIEELRKIETRKREREKKTQDLQKLITAADHSAERSTVRRSESTTSGPNTPGVGRPGRRPGPRKVPNVQRGSGSKESALSPGAVPNILDACIKFPEIKTAGPSLRSARMKLPASVGQKKSKAIEQLLQELSIDLRPMPTEEICLHFNELRSDMVLLYELKMALANCEFDLQTLRHQYEALKPDTPLELQPPPLRILKPATASSTPASSSAAPASAVAAESESAVTTDAGDKHQLVEQQQTPKKELLSEVLDVSSQGINTNRKRKAALEQGNLLRKLKKDVK